MKKVLVIITGFIMIVIINIWLNLRSIDIRYDISEALKEERRLIHINNKLRLKLQGIKSPESLEKIGIKEFNLRKPKKEEIIIG